MTCVVAVVQHQRVYMGADSLGVAGTACTLRADPKVFRLGEFSIGFTSSYRMGQVLRYHFKPPPRDGDSLHEYMVTRFVESWRAVAKQAGIVNCASGVEECGIFLVGVAGQLFEIEADFQVGVRLRSYAAIGSGAPLAEASLYTTQDLNLDPQRRLAFALAAAQAHCTEVREPFIYI